MLTFAFEHRHDVRVRTAVGHVKLHIALAILGLS
jgi:hypothetical protein